MKHIFRRANPTLAMNSYWWVAVLACLQFACSRSPQSYVERGNRMAAAGKYGDAEIEYRKSIQKDPKFAEGYFQLGRLEHQMQHGDQALDDLQRAVDFDRSNDAYAIELANVSIEAYQVVPTRRTLYDQAAQEADALLSKDPNSFDGLRLKGDLLVIDRKYDEALADFRHANTIKPNDPDVIHATAQILFAEKHDQEGEELCQQFLKTRKDFEPMYEILAAAYIRDKQQAKAEQLLQGEIAALPKSARPRLELAALYRSEGRTQEVSQVLQKITGDRATFPAGASQVGDFYSDVHDWDAALAQYRTGEQQSSGEDKLRYQKRIERTLVSMGKRDDALAELTEILKTNPQDPDMRLAQAILLRDGKTPKDRQAAIEELKALATEYPTKAVVHYHLGLAYMANGDSGSAWKELQKSAGLAKEYVAPRLVLADLAVSSRNFTAAQEAAEEVLAVDANNKQARLLHAAALIGGKSYRQAENELRTLAQQQPDSKEVGLQLAALAAGEKDYTKAEGLFRRYYQPGSADLRPLEGLLEVFFAEHHPEKAQAVLVDALKQNPESSPVHLLLASVATQERNYDLASQQYRWLQSKDPNSELPYAELGHLYQLQGSSQDALASYQKAQQLAPNDTKVMSAIAALETKNGQSQQAIAVLNKQLTLDPNNAAAMDALAFNLAETGTDLDRALSLAEAASRRFPNDPAAVDTLGWVYARRNFNQSAIQVLRGLVKKYPNEPTYRYHLAVALLQDKQSSDAKQELQAALSVHPPKDLYGKIQDKLAQIR